MTIYTVNYNNNVHESADYTISIHKTKQGARNMLAKYIRDRRKEYFEFVSKVKDDFIKESYPYFNSSEFEYWDIGTMKLLD